MMQGKKTYMVAAGFVLVAVGQWMTGDATVAESVNQILMGLGLAGVRHGVKTEVGN